MKLAIITTHPIQYYAPIFRLMAQRARLDLMVFYTWGESSAKKFDPGFGATVNWDIPLLEGYPYTWADNISQDPGTHHFRGIITPGLIAQIEDWGADALLVFGWAWQGHLKTLRYFKGKIPIYFRGDSTLRAENTGPKRWVKSLFLRWVYRHVDLAFYVGTRNLAYFKKYGLNDRQLVFAPHAIDNERFGRDREAEAEALRSALGIKREAILLLYAGKFEPVKNVAQLVAAFRQLLHPGLHLLLVGNGPLEASLRQLASATPLAGNIHFRDFTNQSTMPVVYQACDLFCLPSVSETWGLAVNEAMACGKAVLVSEQVGCAPDLVREYRTGLVFKGYPPRTLESCLSRLTRSKRELAELGENARSMIQDWSFEHIVTAIENCLLKMN